MNNEPITRADLNQAVAELREAIRDSQTEILRGMEVFIGASDGRMKRLELGVQAMGGSEVLLNSRITAVESRLMEIEKKILTKGPGHN